MKIFDFRSDTVTKPSPEMWDAIKSMNNSQLGDDVEQEDPTVSELEAKAAEIVGMEAALFVASGTMGNLVSILSQTTPGEEILVEEQSHVYKWEVAGTARLGGLMVRTYPSHQGKIDPFSLSDLIRSRDDYHVPFTTMICMENTHNYHGGLILPPSQFAATRKFADEFDLKFHLDGARIFNASVGLGVDVKEFTSHADSVQFCLSKGLSCPIGSIIAGSAEFIEKARKFRKMVGGGWRQAGIIASFGLIALKQDWIKRLSEDHENAKIFAGELLNSNLPVSVPIPETNIIMLHVPDSNKIQQILHDFHRNGIYTHDMGKRIRFVTHYGLTKEDMYQAVPIIQKVLEKYC